MRSFRVVVTIVIFILASSFSGQKKKPDFHPERVYTIAELQEDFSVLRKTIEKKQPNLYLYTSKVQMDAAFDSLYKGIDRSMDYYEFYNYISPLLSFIKDGHNALLPGEEKGAYTDKHLKYFPLHITSINGKIYSDMNCTRDTTIFDGAELLSINGRSAEEIQRNFFVRMIRDGNNETLPVWIFNTYFRGFYGNFTGFKDHFTITYVTRSGSTATAELLALPIDSIAKIRKEKYKPRLDAQRDHYGMMLRFDSITKTPILLVQSFDPHLLKKYYHVHFKKRVREYFDRIDSAKSNVLIIDVRDNNGGDPVFARYLLQYIMKEKFIYAEETYRTSRCKMRAKRKRLVKCHMPGFGKGMHRPVKHAFQGKVIVLINGGSFSATGEFASVLSRYKRAIFVGEETGGNRTICGGQMFGRSLKLPNTKIVCAVGTEATLIRPIHENDGHGSYPDYFMRNSIQDIISNRDAVMEYALDLTGRTF